MRILFIGYWGFNDSLTTSTILPNLELLQQFEEVEHIVLATIERQDTTEAPDFKLPFPNQKLSFRALYSPPGRSLLRTKADDFLRFPRELAELMRTERLDTLMGHGAPGAALAYLVGRRTGYPFYATMFEPHADYMLDAHIWRRTDPRYIVQRILERQVKRGAKGIIPAAEAYGHQLVKEGVPASHLRTGPCMVRLESFRFDAAAGLRIRQQLGFAADALVGIYVGKFGGLYYDQEAYTVFQEAVAQFGPRFRIIVLTPDSPAQVQARLTAIGLPASHHYVARANHEDVSSFLSAADFAFATIKFAPSNRYRSLVKVGEYWACGLPVLLTEGVGDESAIILAEGGGAIFNLDKPLSVRQGLQLIHSQLQAPNYRQRIRQMAERYRSPERNRLAFRELLVPPAVAIP